jgi:hypothetical protein
VHKWEDNINGIKKIGCKVMNWIAMAQDRVQWQALVNMVMNLQVL